MSSFPAESAIFHPQWGTGTVVADAGETVVARFSGVLQEVRKSELQFRLSLAQKIETGQADTPLEVIHRVQGECIASVNALWGSFSRSRITLLPHQLWVCRQVNASWPTRWLIADDVGLGKTIEAGLILWPLITRGTAKRVLIVCPASLTEQWQERMLAMFDLRFAIYSPESDSDKAPFWKIHPLAIASMQTLRADHGSRHQRLFEADAFDLLIVDEAHHLNADQELGPTLAYELIRDLSEAGQFESRVFFTGTPHRGKNFGFLSLLQLLDERFMPHQPLEAQLHLLSDVMIRNHKASVTDLEGRALFQEPLVRAQDYFYEPAEERFYALLTRFIEEGFAYSRGLSTLRGRAAKLVLVAMQKLASSSVAAIRSALIGRLHRLELAQKQLSALKAEHSEIQIRTLEARLQGVVEVGEDEANAILEEIVALETGVALRQDEVPSLQELLAAADAIGEETKITALLEAVRGRFAGRQVLFFTEYKATQKLLFDALEREFGAGCTTFINGDEKLGGQSLSREDAADAFNAGLVRFLISTEAGGEGIDLQERCHCLVHVDLPWNPMRMHQRVGRLNRYGQKERVEVLVLRNPETVEGRIWEILEAKIHNVNMAFSAVMSRPEDLRQLVLGLQSEAFWTQLRSEAMSQKNLAADGEKFEQWFDEKTARFADATAIDTVKALVGSVNHFDWGQVAGQFPRVDLPDLAPFLETALALNHRRIKVEHTVAPQEGTQEGWSFLTPEAWRKHLGVRPSYEGLHFDRSRKNAFQGLLGAGHKLFEAALLEARNREAALAFLPPGVGASSLAIFRAFDRVTGASQDGRAFVFALAGPQFEPLRDWEVLQTLNSLPLEKAVLREDFPPASDQGHAAQAWFADATHRAQQQVETLDHGLSFPRVEPLALIWGR